MRDGPVTRVLVADASPIIRIGLESVLRSDPEIELVGVCDTGKQAIEMCAQAHPSLLITDVLLPDMSGIEACRAIKQSAPDVDVLIFTANDANETVFEAIRAGASGYVLQDITPENLLQGIRALRRGQALIHPGIARRVLDRFSLISRNGEIGLVHGNTLTGREIEILVEVARGATNKEIAHKLFISESTVKSRLRNIFRKIDARDRAQAAAYAIRRGYAN